MLRQVQRVHQVVQQGAVQRRVLPGHAVKALAGREAIAAVGTRVGPEHPATRPHGAGLGRQLAGHQPQQRGLARAFITAQPGHARRHGKVQAAEQRWLAGPGKAQVLYLHRKLPALARITRREQ